ncbi:MAG: hypothetical protein NT174_05655 [Actinobacteria bacterium]|nr:hypothetical protein [Actinomycetota bacterium]
MSPRKHRRAESGEPPVALGNNEWTEEHPDGLYRVRSITGSSSSKPYRCPGCDQIIPLATPHIVAWLEEDEALQSGADFRRHWHKACWTKKNTRRPKQR